MQSLFILSLPRTFSTESFHIAARALGLKKPSWVMDGEILNVDRYWHYHGIRFDESAKFTTREREPELFAQIHEFLDQISQPENFIYKDVTQPFVMAHWRGLQQFRVLKIERDLTGIAQAMLRNGWYSPQNAASHVAPTPHFLAWARRITPFKYSDKLHRLFRSHFEQGVLEGLVRAERVLTQVEGVTIAYEDVIYDENVLRDALSRLYPQANIGPLSYITRPFIAKRERLARRKETAEYRRLQQRIAEIRARLE